MKYNRKRQQKMYRLNKRPMLLLEVIIALALVALCALPLIAPHLELVNQQRHLSRTVEVDRAVNLLYVQVLEQLQKNKIPWSSIVEHQPLLIEPLVEEMKLAEGDLKISIKGTYRIDEVKHKENEDSGWSVYWLKVVFNVHLPESKKAVVFPYDVTIMRHIPKAGSPSNSDGSSSDESSQDPKKEKEERK